MKAVTWHGKRDVRVDTVPDPTIQEPTDAIIEVTSTNICGSDLHLYEVLGAFMNAGRRARSRADGHRPRSRQRRHQSRGRRPGGDSVSDLLWQLLSCAISSCSPSARPRRCATREWAPRCSATPSSTARCPAGRPSSCGCRRPSSPTSRCPTGPPDSRFVYLSDVLPTAWQAVAYADIPDGGSVTVLGLGPIGDMAARIAQHLGYDVIAVDRVPERLARAEARGVRTIDLAEVGDELADVIRDLTDGRGTDSVIDAVGMEAHGSPIAKVAQQVTGLLPDAIAKPMMQKAGVDRLDALLLGHRHRPPRRHHLADRRVRRDGRPAADAHPVRQADSAAHGSGQRQEVGRRHHAAADRRRSAGRRHLRHPHPAAGSMRRTPTRSSRRSRTARSR